MNLNFPFLDVSVVWFMFWFGRIVLVGWSKLDQLPNLSSPSWVRTSFVELEFPGQRLGPEGSERRREPEEETERVAVGPTGELGLADQREKLDREYQMEKV